MSSQDEALTQRNPRPQSNPITNADVSQDPKTNLVDEEEHIDLSEELASLIGSYQRMI